MASLDHLLEGCLRNTFIRVIITPAEGALLILFETMGEKLLT